MNFPERLYTWTRSCTPAARNIVRSIIASSSTPLTTKDIYKMAVSDATAAAEKSSAAASSQKKSVKKRGSRTTLPREGRRTVEPPFPSHPIRSLTYLKSVVLPSLMNTDNLEKYHTTRVVEKAPVQRTAKSSKKSSHPAPEETVVFDTVDAWYWRFKAKPVQKPVNASVDVFKQMGLPHFKASAVGFREDWSHLNKRRQRSRVGKVQRDLKWMLKLQDARRHAALQELKTISAASPVPSSSLSLEGTTVP